MLFYSSPVLPVICNHPEMLHITTAAGKQAKLVNQGGCGTGQCPHEVFSAYWKSFAQDDPPLLVLHRLHLFCLVEKWPLPAMWSILGRCCRTAFKQFTWTEKQLTETKSFELCLTNNPVNLVKGMLFRWHGSKSWASACVSLSVLTYLMRQKLTSVPSFKDLNNSAALSPLSFSP